MLIWYHGIAMGLLFPHISKIADLQWNIVQNWIIRQKIIISRISPDFLLIKEGNDVSNIYYKIQDHTKKIFLKIVICNIAVLPQPP